MLPCFTPIEIGATVGGRVFLQHKLLDSFALSKNGTIEQWDQRGRRI